MKRLVACGVVLMTMAACGGTPTSPQSSGLAGSWSGAINDRGFGTGTLQMTLNQSNFSVNGTYAVTFQNASNNRNGTVQGVMNGSNAGLNLAPTLIAFPYCLWDLQGSLAGNRLTGTYVAVGGFAECGTQNGNFVLSRQ